MMRNDQPSRTAYRVALHRAAHQVLDDPPVFVDRLALRIIGPRAAVSLRAENGLFSSYLRAFLAVRSRVAEEELARAVRRGVGQYVVLGAGLDTFAYRNPYPESSLRVFEVDHPVTQMWKQRRLEEGGIPIPPGLTFVPVDFEREDLGQALLAAGLRPDRSAFFAWLGVTLYLRLPSIMATLTMIAAASRGGGGVVFDYGVTPSRLGILQRALFGALAARVRALGEPWLTTFDPELLRDDLRGLGFSDVTDLGPEELNTRYFAGRADGLRVGSLARVMVARNAETRRPVDLGAPC